MYTMSMPSEHFGNNSDGKSIMSSIKDMFTFDDSNNKESNNTKEAPQPNREITAPEEQSTDVKNAILDYLLTSPTGGQCPGNIPPREDGSCYGIPSDYSIKNDVTSYESTFNNVNSFDSGFCPGGLAPLSDGTCPGLVANPGQLYGRLYKNPVTKDILMSATQVMQNQRMPKAQIDLILSEVSKYVETEAAKYDRPEYVKKLYTDAFAHALHNVKPGSDLKETMIGTRVGINRTSIRAPTLKKIAMKEHMGQKTNMFGITIARRRGVHEHFNGNTESSNVSENVGTAGVKEFTKEIEGTLTSYDNYNDRFLADANECGDGSLMSENAFENCYAKPGSAEALPNNASSFRTSTSYSFMDDSAQCKDGSYIDGDGVVSCYDKVVRGGKKLNNNTNYNNVYKKSAGWNFCPNDEYQEEIGGCQVKLEQSDYDRMTRELKEGKKHLHQILFPGTKGALEGDDYA